MRRFRILSAGLLLALGAANAGAEDSPSPTLQKGRWSLAFSATGGGGAGLGIWHLISSRVNLGLTVTGSIDDDDSKTDELRRDEDSSDQLFDESDGRSWTLTVEPGIKWYPVVGERVSPFVRGSASFTHHSSRSTSRDENPSSVYLIEYHTDDTDYGVGVGIGVEWTPLPFMSIGGHTGISVSYRRREEIRGSASDLDTRYSASVRHTKSSSLDVDTFRSNLFLTLYF
jgi:opacity protein-like surface antigen